MVAALARVLAAIFRAVALLSAEAARIAAEGGDCGGGFGYGGGGGGALSLALRISSGPAKTVPDTTVSRCPRFNPFGATSRVDKGHRLPA